ncbi:hypothetical protein MPS_3523 [Mycobacterium pseudoshottsii JCM 15466]|nr:hypothetical protein MPS_3523 [Mycobacterium pseudoshottsii JCM 15466]
MASRLSLAGRDVDFAARGHPAADGPSAEAAMTIALQLHWSWSPPLRGELQLN